MSKSSAIIAALTLSSAAIAQGPPHGMPSGSGMPSPEQIVGFMDTDKDGFIAKDEAKGPLLNHFDKIDADKDSKVSLVELKTAMEAMRPPEPAEDELEQPATVK